MTELRRYLQTHIGWRVATVGFALVMVAIFWASARPIAYVFLVIGAIELLLLPYYWRRARVVRGRD